MNKISNINQNIVTLSVPFKLQYNSSYCDFFDQPVSNLISHNIRSTWVSWNHNTTSRNEIFLTHRKRFLFSLEYALFHFTKNTEDIMIGHDSWKMIQIPFYFTRLYETFLSNTQTQKGNITVSQLPLAYLSDLLMC